MKEAQLYLHTGNRMEDLAERLAAVLRRGSGDPFAEEKVLVQSRGMGRWLSLQLADALGICLNVRFPFPREAVEDLLAAFVAEWKGAPGFQRATMVWKVYRLLHAFREDHRFRPIARYLEGDDLLKRLQLADRVANLFDQYLMYRPDWLIAWERGELEEDWQAVLWRELVAESGDELHLAHAWQQLRRSPGEPGSVPSRLCVFGVSSLPPLFLDVFRTYSFHGELHLFLLQPTDQYWGDLVSKKQQARMAERDAARTCYLEEGHPLVASLGRQGQDLLNLLIDAGFQQADDRECFQPPEGGSLLARLQEDILTLTDREADGGERLEVDPDDGSIQVHSCQGPMREIEVLRDQLLERFAHDPELRPRDVLVMIPDIEAYAPYIQAVFGATGGGGEKIPFSVVDRRPRSSHHAIDVWFRLLELAKGRFGAREVVALLESPPFRLRFGLTDREVNSLRVWIQSTGIRWGIDAEHRQSQGLPPVAETTWRNGIDQWLLGYAMREFSEERATSFDGCFPFDEIEGGNIQLLDRFLGVFDFLFRSREKLTGRRSLEAWCSTLSEILEELFAGIEETVREVDVIRGTLGGLKRTAEAAKVADEVSLEVIRHFLENTIEEKAPGGGFLSGGVTFCTLQPMRTIPARLVCLLGMNDDAFPRRQQQLGFDRMRDDHRTGDRSVREDDRYLFLETLLSVRGTLLISYSGQSPRDLTEAPPSVLVSELLDHLDRVCAFPEGKDARRFLVRRHRLQPFHPDYFTGGRFFSYSRENEAACRSLTGEQIPPPPFMTEALSEPEPEARTVSVQQLVRFFRNPSEYFIKERLGMRFPQDEAALEDSEIFEVNPLDQYSLKKEAVDGILEKREPHEWERLQARGQAPLGTPGRAACRSIELAAEKFAERLVEVIGPDAPKENRAVDLALGDFHLRGEIGPFVGGRLVSYRPAKIKAKDRVAAWIYHLAACAAGESERTVLVGEDDVFELDPIAQEEARERLEALLGYYWRGLREPLPFFADTAWIFCETMEKKGDRESAMEAAWTQFVEPSDFRSCEMENTWVAHCWRGREEDAIGDDFVAMAVALFQGFFQADAAVGEGGKR